MVRLTNAQKATLNSAESCLIRDLDQIPSGAEALKAIFDENHKIPKVLSAPLKKQITELKSKYDHSNYSKVPKEAYTAMVAGCVLGKISGTKEVPGTKIPFENWSRFFTAHIFSEQGKALREKLIPEVQEEEGFTASAAEYSCRAVSEVEQDKELAKQLDAAYKTWIKA